MVTDKILMKIGFTKDENQLLLKKVFKNNSILNKIHIDIYSENPLIVSTKSFVLLLRTIENNIIIINNNDRLIFKRNDKYNTYLMNILFSEIKECYCKDAYDGFEFILNIQNIYYRITVLK